MTPDLTHIDTWLFDLDNTLYPPECALMGLVDRRMTDFIMRLKGLDEAAASVLRRRYFLDHGTTLAGLMAAEGVDPAAFIADVQAVEVDCVEPDPVLAEALSRLPGRRLVFTNAGIDYAEKVLARLGVETLFEDIFAIETGAYLPKPQPATYARMAARHSVDAASTAFFEDSERNLAPAHAIGMTTVLVGSHAKASTARFVDHRTATLAPFLNAARVKEPLS